jgi:hypothetical protein
MFTTTCVLSHTEQYIKVFSYYLKAKIGSFACQKTVVNPNQLVLNRLNMSELKGSISEPYH